MSFFETAKAVIVFIFWTVIFCIETIINLFIPLKYKMKSIAGEITLVTGGGSGLGRLTALRLANLGAIVIVWDVNKAGEHLSSRTIYDQMLIFLKSLRIVLLFIIINKLERN